MAGGTISECVAMVYGFRLVGVMLGLCRQVGENNKEAGKQQRRKQSLHDPLHESLTLKKSVFFKNQPQRMRKFPG